MSSIALAMSSRVRFAGSAKSKKIQRGSATSGITLLSSSSKSVNTSGTPKRSARARALAPSLSHSAANTAPFCRASNGMWVSWAMAPAPTTAMRTPSFMGDLRGDASQSAAPTTVPG